ncbi:hypothetical protein IE53DRAFT_106654 [Violaceomyces palustris]|uniref:Uncharacterized protein n=1 Tax=Violaceomyces palustris TaxID=1673888 RepID=A0ACD0NWW1_9BASI|nr:hypothetical protein IE53DRAFT_106654 [Violaceomyces palustris]
MMRLAELNPFHITTVSRSSLLFFFHFKNRVPHVLFARLSMSDPKWGLSSLSNLVIQTYRARWPRTTFKSSTTLDWKIGEDASFRWRGHVHPHPALVVRASVRTIVSTCPNPRRKGDRANSPHHPQVLGKATGSETISCQVEAHDILDETWKTDQGDDQGWGENPLQDKAADLEASEVETRTGHLERRWEGNPYREWIPRVGRESEGGNLTSRPSRSHSPLSLSLSLSLSSNLVDIVHILQLFFPSH